MKSFNLVRNRSRYYFPLLITVLIFSACTLTNRSQSADQTQKDHIVVGKVGNEDVTFKELTTHFQSSNPVSQSDADKVTEFLPVYLNYKAKLKEAKKAGYFDNEDIIKEYQNYAQQAAYSYWLNRVITDSLVNEFYRRSQKEVRASHILKQVSGQPSPEDTVQAYKQLMEARNKYLNKGVPFDTLIKEYSSRRRGKRVGGDLGYFTAGATIKAFEDVAYELDVDSVSKPFRTQYGYHLIRKTGERERKKDRKVSHIFFSSRGKPSQVARKGAFQAYNMLEKGMSWDSAVSQYSEDRASKKRDGQIGWINYGRLDESFVDSVMAIDTVDHYTHPIQSRYGYHIIRIDSIRQYPNKEAEIKALKKKLKELPRFKRKKQYVHQKIRDMGDESVYAGNLKDVYKYVSDRDSLLKAISLPDELRHRTAYKLNGKTYSIGDYFEWLTKNHGSKSTNNYRIQWFDDYVLDIVNEHLIPLTKQRFPDFDGKLDNYMNGLVVFQITQDSVWNYAEKDTARLRKIYQSKPDSFRYGKRYIYTLFASNKDSLLKAAKSRYSGGTPIDTLEKQMKKIFVRRDTTSYVDDFPFSELQNMEENSFSPLLKYKDRKAYLYLNELLEPRQMTFEEAYNRLVSRYQPIREKEWLNSLQEKYNIEVYDEKLKQALKSN